MNLWVGFLTTRTRYRQTDFGIVSSLSSHTSENYRGFWNGRSRDGHVITDLCPFLKDIHNFDRLKQFLEYNWKWHKNDLHPRMVNLEWLKSWFQTSAGTRARGTDLVRLRPKRSVRRPLPSALKFFWTVLRPNPSFRRTEGICPASASVRFEKILTVRFHSLRNYQNDRFFPKWPLFGTKMTVVWTKWPLFLTKMTVIDQNDR